MYTQGDVIEWIYEWYYECFLFHLNKYNKPVTKIRLSLSPEREWKANIFIFLLIFYSNFSFFGPQWCSSVSLHGRYCSIEFYIPVFSMFSTSVWSYVKWITKRSSIQPREELTIIFDTYLISNLHQFQKPEFQ